MKIGDFPIATRIIEARARLIAQRDTGTLTLRIDGNVQDEEMTERIRPIVRLMLDNRIDELGADLAAIGVAVD